MYAAAIAGASLTCALTLVRHIRRCHTDVYRWDEIDEHDDLDCVDWDETDSLIVARRIAGDLRIAADTLDALNDPHSALVRAGSDVIDSLLWPPSPPGARQRCLRRQFMYRLVGVHTDGHRWVRAPHHDRDDPRDSVLDGATTAWSCTTCYGVTWED